MSKIHNLQIVYEGKEEPTPIAKIDANLTVQKLLNAVSKKLQLPDSALKSLFRKNTQNPLDPTRTLADASVSNGETLILKVINLQQGTTVSSDGQLSGPKGILRKRLADVAICIDCTESMRPCIEGVKKHVQELVKGFQEERSIKLDWRVRLIEYRDLNEGEEIIEYPFTTSSKEFGEQVQKLRATGGGPEPESTLDAIFKALHSPWRDQCNKFIVVFTDAPCHPQMHSSTVEPGQPRDVDEVKQIINKTKTRLFLYAPRFDVYNTLARASRVEYNPVPSKDGLASVDFAKLMNTIGKSVSASSEVMIDNSR